MRERAEQDEARRGPLAEQRLVLRRTLRALPDPFLVALSRGLAKHRERLVPGRLFSSPSGGGCAVGVMLRELDPATYAAGGLKFWLRDRWRRGSRSYYGPIAENPRLKHLEWVFDDAVALFRAARPNMSQRAAAAAAGDWVRDVVAEELHWRELRRSFGSAEATREVAAAAA